MPLPTHLAFISISTYKFWGAYILVTALKCIKNNTENFSYFQLFQKL